MNKPSDEPGNEFEDCLNPELLRYFFLHSIDLFCIASTQGFFKVVNPAFEQTLGWPKSVFLSRPIISFIHPDDHKKTVDELHKLSKGYTTVNFENRYFCKNGNIRWLSWTARPGKDDLIFASARDITIQKSLQTYLEARDHHYEEIYNKTPALLHSVNAEGYIISVSDFWLEKMGYERQEVVGKKSIDFLTEESQHLALSFYMPEFFRKGFCRNLPYQFVKKNGEVIDVLLSAISEKDHQGRIIRSLAVIADITELKNAERALRESEKRHRELVAAMTTVTWNTDPVGNFIKDHPEWETYTGQTYEQYKDFGWLEMIHPGDRSALGEAWQKAVENKSLYDNQARMYNSETGKFRHFIVRAVPFLDDSGEIKEWFGANVDIDDIKKQEELLLKQKKELESKNKELARFASVASHDLQEPLQSIKGLTTLIREECDNKIDEEADNYLTLMEEAIDRMSSLIRALLEHAQIGQNRNLSKVDCQRLIKEILSDLKASIDEYDADITHTGLPEIVAYPTELRLLFQNLLSNVIKFRKKSTPPKIHILAEQKEGSWQFSVADNGMGIEEKHLERIFEMFARAHDKHQYKGTGIGLAHCQKIVLLHQGNIWVNSSPSGSTFYFTIPKQPSKKAI